MGPFLWSLFWPLPPITQISFINQRRNDSILVLMTQWLNYQGTMIEYSMIHPLSVSPFDASYSIHSSRNDYRPFHILSFPSSCLVFYRRPLRQNLLDWEQLHACVCHIELLYLCSEVCTLLWLYKLIKFKKLKKKRMGLQMCLPA